MLKNKSNFNNSNVLVIGGAGFIGSNLIDALLANGASVHSLDNYFTGCEDNHSPGCEIHKSDSNNIDEIDFGCTFDYVFHLGEYSRVEESFKDIDLVFEYNNKPIYKILKFVKNQEAKLIYSGSSTQFGQYSENDCLSPYTWTKLKNVDLVNHYAEWVGLNYAITYFYNVYGPREISEGSYATLIAKFIHLVNSGISELPVVSPGTQVRNFTDVRDIVSGLILVALKGEGDGFGIGAEEEYSVLDIVDMLNASPKFIEPRRGNRLSAPVQTDKIKLLGWKQEYFLTDYLSAAKNDSFEKPL